MLNRAAAGCFYHFVRSKRNKTLGKGVQDKLPKSVCPSLGPTRSSRIRPADTREAGETQETPPGLPPAEERRGLADRVSGGPRAASSPERGVRGRGDAPAGRSRRGRWSPAPKEGSGSECSVLRGAGKVTSPGGAWRPPGPRPTRALLGACARRWGCARGQEAEGRQQEPAPGTTPPRGGSEAGTRRDGVRQQGSPRQVSRRAGLGVRGRRLPPRTSRLLALPFAQPPPGGARPAQGRRPRRRGLSPPTQGCPSAPRGGCTPAADPGPRANPARAAGPRENRSPSLSSVFNSESHWLLPLRSVLMLPILRVALD